MTSREIIWFLYDHDFSSMHNAYLKMSQASTQQFMPYLALTPKILKQLLIQLPRQQHGGGPSELNIHWV